MENSVRYLSSHPEIQEALLILGANETEGNWAADLLETLSLVSLKIYTPDRNAAKKLKKKLETLQNIHPSKKNCRIIFPEENELGSQGFTASESLLFLANPDSEDVLESVEGLRPYCVAGTVDSAALSSFRIWERFREKAEFICIETRRSDPALRTPGGLDSEALNWHRNGSGIELSVIYPMYNVAKYLPQCISTTTAWGADYVEYLFVDDGSPDNCAEIIEQYARKDPRIRLLRKKNGGCASARQFGLENARGRYIGFIDPDDYTDPAIFQKLLVRALTGSYEIVYSGYNEYYENNGKIRKIPDALGSPYREGTADQNYINRLIAFCRVAIWRGIYLKEMIDRSGIHFYTDLRRFDDLPFKVETFSKARSVAAIPEHLYYYRLSRPGQDVSADDERLYVHFPIFEYLNRFFDRSKDPRQMDFLLLVKIQTHSYALKKIRPEFFREYCRQASLDIRSRLSYSQGYFVVKSNLGKKAGLLYRALYHNHVWAVRALISFKNSKSDAKTRSIRSIKEYKGEKD